MNYLISLSYILFLSIINTFLNINIVYAKEKTNILDILYIIPSQESTDYVNNKSQFQLHSLITEQRHPKTSNFSDIIQKNTLSGLQMLNSVDDDVKNKLMELSKNTFIYEKMSSTIANTILEGKKVFIYGCGATGRLAKQMESTFWRPYWQNIKNNKNIWNRIIKYLPNIEERLIGEMTGADRALISSLEGFEDLQLIGSLQVDDRGIKKGDVVIAVTEGGETSSVIGAILKAHNQWKELGSYSSLDSSKYLYFVYNNPDELLLPFDRSRGVLKEDGITKINLTTGPQAIAGSTRMQATTIETYVIGTILESAIYKLLSNYLNTYELRKVGFTEPINFNKRFLEFGDILESVKDTLPELSELTDIEAETYKNNNFSTYFAGKGIITVFTDSTERSPTFRLVPLDTIHEKNRKSWIQVWTESDNQPDGWLYMLKRPFRGLSEEIYRKPFETEICDAYLKNSALNSLKNAGNDQQNLYDFSFSNFNMTKRNFKQGDFGLAISLSPEEETLLANKSYFRRFFGLVENNSANAGIIMINYKNDNYIKNLKNNLDKLFSKDKQFVLISVLIDNKNDPLLVKQNIAAKLLLNTHSTAVMGILGKVVGNTMTNVSPSNLKLIGRATYLILTHVNDMLTNPDFVKKYGTRKYINYMEANAVLYDSIKYLKGIDSKSDQPPEVALSIIRILESLKFMKYISNDDALKIVTDVGLANYLSSL